MKTGRTLTQIAAELDRQNEQKRDFVANTGSINAELIDGKNISFHLEGVNESFQATQHTHRQIGDRLKIPAAYYDRIRQDHPELLARTLNTFFHDEPERRLIRTLDGNARAFLSDRYRTLDNFDLAQAVLPVLAEAPDMQVVSTEITDHRFYLKALFPRTEMEVARGDAVQAGVVISNSEIGKGSLRVEPLIYRLVCLNGMIAADHGTKKYHVGRSADGGDLAYEVYRDETLRADDRALWLKVQDTVRASLDTVQFGKIVDQMRRATEVGIGGDPVKAVEEVQRVFNLTDGERGGVLRHLIEGGDLSQFGLLNAITRTSQDIADYDRATDFERMGGQILELPRNQWEQIAAAA